MPHWSEPGWTPPTPSGRTPEVCPGNKPWESCGQLPAELMGVTANYFKCRVCWQTIVREG